MTSAVPVLFAPAIHQPQIRLMDQGGGLKRLPRLLLGEFLSGQLSQLGIHQWQQIRSRLWIAMTNGIEQLRYFRHEVKHSAAAAAPPLNVIGGRFLDRAAVSLLDAPELLKIRLIVMPPARDDFGIENDAAFGVDRLVGGPCI